MNPAIVPVLDHYPLPNDPKGAYGDRTYAASSKIYTRTDQFSVRVDHRISDKASLLTRFSLNQVTGPLTNPDQTAIDPSFAVQFFDHQRNAGVKYSRTISPHFLSDTSFSYIRSTPFFPAINHTQPAMTFGDGLFQAFNQPGGSIFGSYSNLYQLKQDMSYVRSNHLFKWGVEIRHNRDATIFGHALRTPRRQWFRMRLLRAQAPHRYSSSAARSCSFIPARRFATACSKAASWSRPTGGSARSRRRFDRAQLFDPARRPVPARLSWAGARSASRKSHVIRAGSYPMRRGREPRNGGRDSGASGPWRSCARSSLPAAWMCTADR